jgi:hypothetical protein
LAATPSDDARRILKPSNQFALRLHHIVKRDAVWTGDAYYIDLVTANHNAALDGAEDISRYGEGRGAVTPTAFLYSPTHDVLLLQSRNDAINRTRFAYFLQKLFSNMNHKSGKVDLAPVFSLDATERLAELDTVAKVNVNVASGINATALEEPGDTAERLIKIADSIGGLRMKIEISTGVRGLGLRFEEALSLVNSFSRAQSELEIDLASLKVSGYHPDEPGLDPVELVNEKMRDSVNLELNNDGLILYQERSAALLAFYEDREAELDRMYAP